MKGRDLDCPVCGYLLMKDFIGFQFETKCAHCDILVTILVPPKAFRAIFDRKTVAAP